MLLKINRFKTKALDNLRGQFLNLEQSLMSITNQEQNIEVVNSIAAGNDALKQLQTVCFPDIFPI